MWTLKKSVYHLKAVTNKNVKSGALKKQLNLHIQIETNSEIYY